MCLPACASTVRHAATRACVVFLLAFNVFDSVSSCLQCVHVLHMLCVCVCACDNVYDVCGGGGGGGDGGGAVARLELHAT